MLKEFHRASRGHPVIRRIILPVPDHLQGPLGSPILCQQVNEAKQVLTPVLARISDKEAHRFRCTHQVTTLLKEPDPSFNEESLSILTFLFLRSRKNIKGLLVES